MSRRTFIMALPVFMLFAGSARAMADEPSLPPMPSGNTQAFTMPSADGQAFTIPNTDGQAFPMPTDNKLVVFQYDANQSYTILTLPDTVTDIEIGPDEHLVAPPALGDTVQWRVQAVGRHVFVKPVRNNIFTSMTLVTDKRSYEITLRASPAGGKWYQRVTWQYPDIVIANFKEAEADQAAHEAKLDHLAKTTVASETDYTKLNFDYSVSGDSDLKPATVFDDGKFTYIRMKKSSQTMPVVFVENKNGKKEIVNYDLRGDYMVIQRVARRFILQNGHEKATMVNNHIKSGGIFSFW